MTSKAKCLDSFDDGFAFRFEVPREDLSLYGVQLEDDTPVLLFKVAKKVPTITEEDVATCIQLSLDRKRPEFFYMPFLPDHPLAGTGRHYKYYKPSYLRRTSIGETLALVDWHMKCLGVGVRGDKEKGTFQSWPAVSELEGLASYECFPMDPSKPCSVFMKCKEVSTYKDENQLVFVEEPKMAIEQGDNPGYSNYITHYFDSIAYYDEPLFLKMKEIIKLILAAEWLRDKGVHFSEQWLEENAAKLQDAPKPLHVDLTKEQEAAIMKQLQQEAEKAFKQAALKQPVADFALSKYSDCFSATKLTIQVKNGNFEVHTQRIFADSFFEQTTDLYVPVVQKVVMRATLHDFDFLYQGMDPNMPVIIDPDTAGGLVKPEVSSWSELFCETEPYPCKWLQDPDNPENRSPALTGGVCTSSIPVRSTAPAPGPVTSQKRVTATKGVKKPQRVQSRDLQPQPVVEAPPRHASYLQSSQKAVDKPQHTFHGHEDDASSFGVSGDGQTSIQQPSLHVHKEIIQLIGGKEVGPPLRASMHLRLPPQTNDTDKESVTPSDDSGYSGSPQCLSPE